MVTDNKDDAKAAEDKAAEIIKATESVASSHSDTSNSPEANETGSNEPPVLSDTVSTDSLNDKPEDNSEEKPKEKPKNNTQSNSQTASNSTSAAASKKTEPPKKPKQAKSKGQKKSGGGIGWLALLVALVALTGVGYQWWLQQQGQKAESAELTRQNQLQLQQIDNVKANTQSLSQQVSGFTNKSADQQKQIAELQVQLQATTRQIGEVTQVSRRSWMLAEAEYLLRLANQRLLMERETTGALTLLTSADKILLTVAEPSLFEVREQLAREVADLRAVGQLDVEGVFVQLAALGEQVETLALLTPEGKATQTPAQISGEGEQADAEGGGVFASALEHFGDMVIVRHRDEPLEPLLTPKQHVYVQQNLRLMLEQAQLALLQRKPGVYSRSLSKAESWVQEYFKLNANSEALLATLQELKQVHVDPELPDISASLGLLKAYLTLPAPGEQAEPGAAQAGAAQ